MTTTTAIPTGTRVQVRTLNGVEFGNVHSDGGFGRITVRFDDRTITSFPDHLVKVVR